LEFVTETHIFPFRVIIFKLNKIIEREQAISSWWKQFDDIWVLSKSLLHKSLKHCPWGWGIHYIRNILLIHDSFKLIRSINNASHWITNNSRKRFSKRKSPSIHHSSYIDGSAQVLNAQKWFVQTLKRSIAFFTQNSFLIVSEFLCTMLKSFHFFVKDLHLRVKMCLSILYVCI
jgi:hypothetical protein